MNPKGNLNNQRLDSANRANSKGNVKIIAPKKNYIN